MCAWDSPRIFDPETAHETSEDEVKSLSVEASARRRKLEFIRLHSHQPDLKDQLVFFKFVTIGPMNCRFQ